MVNSLKPLSFEEHKKGNGQLDESSWSESDKSFALRLKVAISCLLDYYIRGILILTKLRIVILACCQVDLLSSQFSKLFLYLL